MKVRNNKTKSWVIKQNSNDFEKYARKSLVKLYLISKLLGDSKYSERNSAPSCDTVLLYNNLEGLHHLDWQISFKNRVKKSNIKKTLLRKSFDKCQKEIVFKFCFNLSKVRDHVKSVPKASRLPLSVIDLCFLNLIG